MKNLFEQFEYKISLLALKQSIPPWSYRSRDFRWENKRWLKVEENDFDCDKSNEKWFWLKFSPEGEEMLSRQSHVKAFSFTVVCPYFRELLMATRINGRNQGNAFLPLHLANTQQDWPQIYWRGLPRHSCGNKKIFFDYKRGFSELSDVWRVLSNEFVRRVGRTSL